MKKILMLGGNFLQKTAIQRAKELGYYVICVDMVDDVPGHEVADEFYNISTTDDEAVFALAKEKKIDGILSYASDVSACTAAYVAEKLGLPTNPYKSVEILTHKELFKAFMKEHGHSVAEGSAFNNKDKARVFFENMMLPVIIKPTDASGSKGVKKVIEKKEFDEAYDEAAAYSRTGMVMIEQFIQKKGYQIDGDGFIKDGKIVFFGVMDQHNNIIRNPHAPIGLSYPSIQENIYQEKAQNLIQTIFDELGMKFGAFNFEYIIGEDDEIYLLEIGPRNGGNFIPDTIQYATGVDMVEASIRACVGDKYDNALICNRNRIATSYVVHSMKSGKFSGLNIHPAIKANIIKQELVVNFGEEVQAFRNGRDCIGMMVIVFDTIEKMNAMMDSMWEYIEIIVD